MNPAEIRKASNYVYLDPETHGSIFGWANTFRITFEFTGLRDFSRRPGGMMG